MTPGRDCTFCKDNPLINPHLNHPEAFDKDLLLDHIFAKNLFPNLIESNAEILFKENFIESNHGDHSFIPLSDHYGVKTIYKIISNP